MTAILSAVLFLATAVVTSDQTGAPQRFTVLGEPRYHVQGHAKAIAFSPDGKRLAAVVLNDKPRTDVALRLWDARSGRLIAEATESPGSLSLLRFGSDGQRLFTENGARTIPSLDSAASLWQGRLLCVSGCGEAVAVQESGAVIAIWNVPQGKRRCAVSLSGDVRSAALSPGGRRLAVATADMQLHLWDLGSEENARLVDLPGEELYQLVFSPDGRWLVVCGKSESIPVVGVAAGRIEREFPTPFESAPIFAAAFSPDGKTLATSSHGGTTIWDWANQVEVEKIERSRDPAQALAFSPDGSLLAIDCRTDYEGSRLHIVDTKTWRPREVPGGPSRPVRQLIYAPDGRHLLAGSDDGHVYVWDVDDKTLRHRIEIDSYLGLAASPDSWLVGAVGQDGEYRLCELDTGRELVHLRGRGPVVRYSCAAFAPELTPFALGLRGGKIEIHDAAGERTLQSLSVFSGRTAPHWMALARDGNRIAVVDDQGPRGGLPDTVDIWDVGTGAKIRSLNGVVNVSADGHAVSSHEFRSVHWLGDDSTLAAVDDGHRCHFWELVSGTHLGVTTVDRLCAFSADGRYVAYFVDGQPVLVEIASGQLCFAVLPSADHPGGRYSCLAIAPDLSHIAAAHAEDLTIHVWSLAPHVDHLADAKPTADVLWHGLAAEDGVKAYEAIWRMADLGDESTALLAEKLVPVTQAAADGDRIRELIDQLDDDDFSKRQRASQALVRLGSPVIAPLKEVLSDTPNAEVRFRAVRILREIGQRRSRLPLEQVRRLRAVAVLEMIGSPAAELHLHRLAGGDDEARQTRHARAALRRISTRDADDSNGDIER